MKYYYNGAEILAPFSISSNEPMFDADTVSLKKQRATQNAQRWEMSFNVINAENPADIFVNTLVDFDSAKTMIMPQLKAVEESLSLSASEYSTAGASSGVSSLTIYRNSSTATDVIPKGYFFTFTESPKLYVVTQTINWTAENPSATLNFYPRLTTNVTSNNNINFENNVLFTHYRDISDLRGLTFSDGILSNLGTINLLEAL